MFASIVAISLGHALGDGYGGGLAKNTYAASDPTTTVNWLFKFLPFRCQDEDMCNTSISCANPGRSALCTDENCSVPTNGPGKSFGLHSVNTNARPEGSVPGQVKRVEQEFTRRFVRAVAEGDPNEALLDFSTVFYTPDLDQYISRFSGANEPFLALRWKADDGASMYSILVHVAESQIILELVSRNEPTTVNSWVEDDLVRLPSIIFTEKNVLQQDKSILQILAVSKAASNLNAVQRFYADDLGQQVAFSASKRGAHLLTFKLTNATAHIRYVQRPLNAMYGLSVADIEHIKLSAHRTFQADHFCGVTKWFDNHYAWDQSHTNLDSWKARFDADGTMYHIFGDGSGMTNMYLVDPTGESIQMDGSWINTPTQGSGDALQAACSQGSCGRFSATAKCKSKMEELCPGLEGSDGVTKNSPFAPCSVCAYGNWLVLAAAGCTAADVPNYCVTKSITCYNKCDEQSHSGPMPKPNGSMPVPPNGSVPIPGPPPPRCGKNCSQLLQTKSCAKDYCPTCKLAGWCDKECGFNACSAGVESMVV